MPYPHEYIYFQVLWTFNLIKNNGWNLVGITDEPNGSMFDNDYFCIHEDLFDIIQSTRQENNI